MRGEGIGIVIPKEKQTCSEEGGFGLGILDMGLGIMGSLRRKRPAVRGIGNWNYGIGNVVLGLGMWDMGLGIWDIESLGETDLQ